MVPFDAYRKGTIFERGSMHTVKVDAYRKGMHRHNDMNQLNGSREGPKYREADNLLHKFSSLKPEP